MTDTFVSGNDDFIESEIFLDTSNVNENWFSNFNIEMKSLDQLAYNLCGKNGKIASYCKEQKMDGEKLARQASNVFWQLCEQHFQSLVDTCGQDPTGNKAKEFRSIFAEIVKTVYETFCPQDTARQLEAWAKNRPDLGWYLKGEEARKIS